MKRIPLIIAAVAMAVVLLIIVLLWHAAHVTNTSALADAPRPVSVVAPKGVSYRDHRAYVGTFAPWVQASVGPQFVAAYIDTVLVRPGAIVKRRDILATLDCRNASTTNRAVSMQARAIEERQHALADQAARIQSLLEGHFVSADEAEQKQAQSASETAQLAAAQASLARSSLEVDDCVLRAPFDGEVSSRTADPGVFVRPGMPIVQVVDRSTLRFTVDVPEDDFAIVAPKTPVRIHSTASNRDFDGAIARRAPATDDDTRTVRVEVDVPDPEHVFPVGSTGELSIDIGSEIPALRLPNYAATVKAGKATVFVVADNVARKVTVPVLGQRDGGIFLAQDALESPVVSEGRALLKDGDQVQAKNEATENAQAAK